jgi:hypothetical protein
MSAIDFIEIIDEFDLAKKTKENIRYVYRKLIKDIDNPTLGVFNFDLIQSIGENIDKLSTKRTFYAGILSMYKHYALYASKNKLTQDCLMSKDIFKKVSKLSSDTRINDEERLSKQEYELHYTLKELYDIFKSYDEDSMEYLFLATNILIPPRRRDWGDAKFIVNKEDTAGDQINFELYDDKLNNVIVNHKTKDITLNFNIWKLNHKYSSYNKYLNNDEYNYLSFFEYLNPSKLGKLLYENYVKKPRTNIFMNGEVNWDNFATKIYTKHPNLTQNAFRHAFSQVVFNPNRIAENKLKAITWDFGDKSIETMRRYSTFKIKDIEEDNEVLDTESSEDITKYNESVYTENEDNDTLYTETDSFDIDNIVDTKYQNALEKIQYYKKEIIKIENYKKEIIKLENFVEM